MVRIPPSAVTVGPSRVSAQPIREAIGIGGAVAGLTEAGTEFASRLAEAERARELTRMSSDLENSLVDLQISIAQDPELNTVGAAEQAFTEGADQIFTDLGESDSVAVNDAIQGQFLKSSLRARVSVKQSAFKRQSDAAIAELDVTREKLERSYAAAPDDEKREEIRDLYARDINLSAYLSEQEKGDLIRDFETDTDVARVTGLINSGDFDSAQELLGSDQLVGVDPQKNLALQKTLEIARKRAKTDLDADLKRIEDERTSQMLRRFFDPEDPDGVPTVIEVLDAGLPRVVAEHFIQMVEDHAIGKDINKINPNVENSVYRRIHDPDHPNPITDINQILPHVGNGISPEKAEQFRQDLKDLVSPEVKIRDRLFNDFLKAAEGEIDKSSLFGGKDGKGGQLFFDFRLSMQLLFEEGIKEGKDPRNLLDNESTDYIGKTIDQYIRDPLQIAEDMAAGIAALGADTKPTPKLAPPTRTEDESPEAFLERTGQ